MNCTIERLAFRYLEEKAPVIFLLLSGEGKIIRANAYANSLTGMALQGLNIEAMLGENCSPADILAAGAAHREQVEEMILTIKTRQPVARSFHCHIEKLDDHLVLFGRIDVEELEATSREVLSLNQELNNLTRQLHLKNRELEQANKKITELTRTDPLTGLANRRYFDERIEEMASLALRKSQPLSIILTDIDKFKTINDQFGHNIGDIVLKGYADLMKQNTRTADLVTRYGGEEFIILLPFTDEQHAFLGAERIRRALAQLDLVGNGHVVTASFGISRLCRDEPLQEFIKRADQALYKAKQSGRNQTIVADCNKPAER